MSRLWLALAIGLAALVAASALGAIVLIGGEELGAEALLARRDALKAFADTNPVLTLAIFVAIYFAIISFALPVGPPMSLTAGFLFGPWLGTAAVVLGATAGAMVVFSVARATGAAPFGLRLRARAGPGVERLAADLRANAFGYLLVARLVPFFPFFLVNVAAGLAEVRARTFLLATLIGRMPAAFLYVSLGRELGRATSFADLTSPHIAATLLGLGALALIPVVLNHHRASRA